MKEKELEKVPLLIVYRQGDRIFADQPEEIIDHFQLYAFLKLYVDRYGDKLKEEEFHDEELE